MQTDTNANVVPISATIRADQRDRLVAFARQSGAISLSEALRDLLDQAFHHTSLEVTDQDVAAVAAQDR